MDVIAKYKNDLLLQINTNYTNLINCLNSIPLNPQFKSWAFQNLDQGIMWVHKSIELSNFNPPVEEKKEEIKIPESKDEVPSDAQC